MSATPSRRRARRLLDPLRGRLRRLRLGLRRFPSAALALDWLALAQWRARLRLLAALHRLSGGRAGRRVSLHPERPVRLRPGDVRRGLWRLDLLAELGLRRQRDVLGLVVGGDWDRDSYDLDELGIFAALRRRFVDGAAWEEIPYFEEMRALAAAGEPRFKYRTPEDVPRQWRRIDRLHRTLVAEGYHAQRELGSRRPWDEIGVAFDRSGRPLFLDGRHRLALAGLLAFDTVPAVVGPRHLRWEELRREIGGTASPGRRLPAHPDLPGTPWPPILDPLLDALPGGLPTAPATVLDLEPGHGHWCQQLELRGLTSWAWPGPADRWLDRLVTACGLETRILDPSRPLPPPAPHPVPLALALGGGDGRLWDLPAVELERRFARLRRAGWRIERLVAWIGPGAGGRARGTGFPEHAARATGLRPAEETDAPADLGGGRWVVLEATDGPRPER